MTLLATVFLSLFAATPSEARVIGLVPTIESRGLRLLVSTRSDLWTKPDQDKDAPVRVYGLDLRIPVLQGEKGAVSAQIHNEALHPAKTGLTVGETPELIGTNLTSRSIGFGASYQPNENLETSIFASHESASDEPFRDIRDKWVEASAIAAIRVSETRHWVLAVNSSNNRGFRNGELVPYVGVRQMFSPTFEATFGFPFLFLRWGQTSELSGTQVTLTPVGVHLESLHQVGENVGIGVNGGLAARSYLNTNRTDDDTRVIYQETFFEAAGRLQASEGVQIGLVLGGSFNRTMYQARQVFHPIGSRTTMPSDVYGGFRMEFEL